MKIVTVLGARPQFVKAGTVSREIRERENLKEVIVHTGQHFDANMSDVFFDEMQIPRPDYRLDINGMGHGAMTGQMIERIEAVLQQECPDAVLVYGDTNSTLAGALAAAKLQIPVAHVEAGLRSFNTRMPEELNRILTDRVSSRLFCPTETAVRNLEAEGFPYRIGDVTQTIENVGDVMYDGALFYAKLARNPEIPGLGDVFVLATVHRAENTDDTQRLRSIFAALEHIAQRVPVVLPLHPRTRGRLEAEGIALSEKLFVIEPVGYLEMVWLIRHAQTVLTDSGGLQKEASFFEKYCITLRDETEWVELVQTGVNVLAGAKTETIVRAFEAIQDRSYPGGTALYGDGHAAGKIVDTLMRET